MNDQNGAGGMQESPQAGQGGVGNAASTIDSVAAFTESAIEERRKKRASNRRAGIIAAAVVAGVVAIYAGGAAWFGGHFLPNTNIGGYEVSGLSVQDANEMLDAASGDYVLNVSGEGLDFQVASDDTGLRIDSEKVVQKAIDANEALAWPAAVVGAKTQDLTDAMRVTFDEDSLKKFVKKQVKALNKKADAPTSATIAYDKKSGAFAIVPEKLGGKLDSGAVLEKVREAALQMQETVEMGEDELLRPDVLSDDERLAKALDEANGLLGADIQLTLAGLDWKEVDGDLISGWVELSDKLKPTLNDDKLRDWAGKAVGKVNTIGATRKFTTPRGDSVTVEGGSYGWQVDYEPFLDTLKQAVADRTVGTVEVPCVQYAASLPDKKNADFGSRYVDVNLSAQHAVFYDGDDVLWESDFISGAPDAEHSTPTGMYMVNLKESPSKLVGEMQPVEITTGKGKKKTTYTDYQPEYETEVQYWMPFVGNAVGFHDATWQPGFGGTMYADGYGSHGCINLSYDAAEQLYGIITEGTPVAVHY